MPLDKSGTKKAFSNNIKTEMAAGKPQRQAVAIAYATQGEKKVEHKKGNPHAHLDAQLGAEHSKKYTGFGHEQAHKEKKSSKMKESGEHSMKMEKEEED